MLKENFWPLANLFWTIWLIHECIPLYNFYKHSLTKFTSYLHIIFKYSSNLFINTKYTLLAPHVLYRAYYHLNTIIKTASLILLIQDMDSSRDHQFQYLQFPFQISLILLTSPLLRLQYP